jgi:epoxyqueuosine reductase
MNLEELKNRLREKCSAMGASLFGVCRIDDLRDSFHREIKDRAGKLQTALAIGIPLSKAVMDTIEKRPNMIYKAHYQSVNHALNDVALIVSRELQDEGFAALPIPASRIINWKPLRAHLSHREIAYKAGLGWWGRNNLLVTKKSGSKIRLVTVLTDAGLPVDKPSVEDCGGCMECLYVCPAEAISQDREHFNLEACYAQVTEFSRHDNYGHLICGICLKACNGGE